MSLAAAEISAALLDGHLRRLRTSLVFGRFCRLLREAGVPLDRANLSLRQLHPELVARSYHWDFESGGAATVDRPYSVMTRADFLASPLAAFFRDGQVLRRRLLDPSCAMDFDFVRNLKAERFSDYRVSPVHFTGGQLNSLSIATRHRAGFTEADLALLDACVPALAAVAEIQQLRDTAQTLLSTYVGHRTGSRVWAGTIRRGEGERLHALVYLCDLGGFTQLAATLPMDATMALLNDYFDAMGAAVVRHGGEILKFIGDALLAIFPCRPGAVEDCPSAAAALTAAEEGLATLAAINERRVAAAQPALEARIALSVGELLYGNIGVPDRLDFTVIGPAVNLASRLQALAAILGEPVLLSAEVAARLARPLRSRGRHALKGVGQPVEVFAP
jgi:adenylate cyclase